MSLVSRINILFLTILSASCASKDEGLYYIKGPESYARKMLADHSYAAADVDLIYYSRNTNNLYSTNKKLLGMNLAKASEQIIRKQDPDLVKYWHCFKDRNCDVADFESCSLSKTIIGAADYRLGLGIIRKLRSIGRPVLAVVASNGDQPGGKLNITYYAGCSTISGDLSSIGMESYLK